MKRARASLGSAVTSAKYFYSAIHEGPQTHIGWHQVTTVQLPFHQIFSFRRFTRQLVSKCDGTAASHHEDTAQEEGATQRHFARPVPVDYANSTRRPPARPHACRSEQTLPIMNAQCTAPYVTSHSY